MDWVYHKVPDSLVSLTVASNGVVIKAGKALLVQWTGVKDVTVFVGFRPEMHECKIS